MRYNAGNATTTPASQVSSSTFNYQVAVSDGAGNVYDGFKTVDQADTSVLLKHSLVFATRDVPGNVTEHHLMRIHSDGFVGVKGTSTGDYISSVADGASAIMHHFDLANSPATKYCSPFAVTYGSNVIFKLATHDSTSQTTITVGSSAGTDTSSCIVREYISPSGAGVYYFYASQAYFNAEMIFSNVFQMQANGANPTNVATQRSSHPLELKNTVYNGGTPANQIHQIINKASVTTDEYSGIEFVMNRGSAGGGAITNAGGFVYEGVNNNVWLKAPAVKTALPDAELANSQMALYLDAAENNLTIKVKTSGGTVKTATIALA